MFRVVKKGFLEWFWSFRGSTYGGFYNIAYYILYVLVVV